MKLRRALAATLVLFACLGAKSQDDGYSLNWKPKEGQALNYELTMDMTAAEQKITFMGDMTLKVMKVATNGDYTLETARKNLRVLVAGEEHPVPDEDNKPTTQIFNAKGEQIGGDKEEVDEPDEISAILDAVGDFTSPDKPVKKGDKWSHEIKADEKKAIKAAKIDYEVLGTDKIGAYDVIKVSMSYKQTEGSKPTSFEGTISFDVRDMSLVETEASVRDVSLGDSDTGDMKVKLVRQ